MNSLKVVITWLIVTIGCLTNVSAAPVPSPDPYSSYDYQDYLFLEPDYEYSDPEDYYQPRYMRPGGGYWFHDTAIPPHLKPMHAPFMGKKPKGQGLSGRSETGELTMLKPGTRPRPIRPITSPVYNGKHVMF